MLKSVRLKTLLIHPNNLYTCPNGETFKGYPPLGIPALVGYLNSLGYFKVRSLSPDLVEDNLESFKKTLDELRLKNRNISFRSFIAASIAQRIDANPELLKQIKIILKSGGYGLAGFSILYAEDFFYSLKLARAIRSIDKDVFIVFGGPFMTRYIKDIISYDSVGDLTCLLDGIVAGNGEEPLAELIRCLDAKERLDRVPNLYYAKNNAFKKPASLFQRNAGHMTTPNFNGFKLKTIPLIMSLGCSWGKCVFCTYKNTFPGYQEIPVDILVDRIKQLAKKHRIDDFIFYNDDNTPSYLKRFSEELIKQKVRISWNANYIGANDGFLSGDIPALMRQAGCREAFFGIESMSARVLKLMNKRHDGTMIKKLLQAFKKAGIRVSLSVIYGFPTETKKEILETLEFLKNNQDLFSVARAYHFLLLDNTDIFNNFKKYGIKKIDLSDKYLKAPSGSPHRCPVFAYNYTPAKGLTEKGALAMDKYIAKLPFVKIPPYH